MFIDGKSFADDEMIIALRITLTGEKIPLGFIQAASENERVLKSFLSRLLGRGLGIEEGILCIIDGAKGICLAIRKVFTGQRVVSRIFRTFECRGCMNDGLIWSMAGLVQRQLLVS